MTEDSGGSSSLSLGSQDPGAKDTVHGKKRARDRWENAFCSLLDCLFLHVLLWKNEKTAQVHWSHKRFIAILCSWTSLQVPGNLPVRALLKLQSQNDNGQTFVYYFKPEVERDPFCQTILRTRMMEGALEQAPIHGDIRSFRPSGPALAAETMTAGFPCQAGPT